MKIGLQNNTAGELKRRTIYTAWHAYNATLLPESGSILAEFATLERSRCSAQNSPKEDVESPARRARSKTKRSATRKEAKCKISRKCARGRSALKPLELFGFRSFLSLHGHLHRWKPLERERASALKNLIFLRSRRRRRSPLLARRTLLRAGPFFLTSVSRHRKRSQPPFFARRESHSRSPPSPAPLHPRAVPPSHWPAHIYIYTYVHAGCAGSS